MILSDSVYFIGRGMERSSAGNKFSEQGMDSSSREWCFDKWKSSSESSGDMFVSQVFFSVICENWLVRFAVIFFLQVDSRLKSWSASPKEPDRSDIFHWLLTLIFTLPARDGFFCI